MTKPGSLRYFFGPMQTPATRLPRFFGVLISSILLVQGGAQGADLLEAGFQSPPDSAKPQTWWHWMNGNVTREGVTADLEAMKQIGLGGAEIFNADCGIPAGPVKFNSPEWHDLFKYTVQEANRLGLQIEAHNCAGWSSSGGPWNTASNGMMMVVTSEIRVTGPTNYEGTLPEPAVKLDYYRDIAVLAFRTPDGEEPGAGQAKVTCSSRGVDVSALAADGNTGTVTLPRPTGTRPQFIQFEFPKPFLARTVQVIPGTGTSGAKGVIQASSDGVIFRDCGQFTLSHRPTRPVFFSLGDNQVPARFYRLVFNSVAADAKGIALRGVTFSPRMRIEDFETKDGDTGGFVNSMSSDSTPAGACGLSRGETVELTAKLDSAGRLKWQVPAGDWTILRVGFTPSGRENHPAPVEGTGLECDKFSTAALDAHWAGFMGKLVEDAGPLTGKTFVGGVIDSYEVGGQNWSAGFREEFKHRRGYDPVPYLAAFTGRVVDSPQVTERFLWDVRRTIADLFAENYYGHFTELCNSNGLISSIEPYTGPYESLQSGRPDDIVMGEFWSGSQGEPSVKLAASVAHIYGGKIVGAESFTAAPGADHGRWLDTPYSLKALGDLEYCTGLNRYIFHRYAMQPWMNRWPGMTMGQWGIHFDRTETWWTQGKAWIDYVSRCQFLLQQGRYVADAAYFVGESVPSEMPSCRPELPPGYQYDAINADVLLHRAAVKGGRLNLESGASYAVLILPPENPNMTPELLERIRGFVHDGLTVVGGRPQYSPSLENFPRCDARVRSMAGKMWGKCDGFKITEHVYGKGRIVWGEPMTNVLAGLNLPADFGFKGHDENSNLIYCHRQLPEADIYFVSNQRHRFDSAECDFRCGGRVPELWNPQTGVMQPAPVWREENGRTIVPLQFDPAGSVFVVFRQKPQAGHFVAVEFQKTGAPEIPKHVELHILSAVYGASQAPGQTWMDVTMKVQSLVTKGTLKIPAENGLAGDDPAPDLHKQLRVEYTLNGQPQSAVAEENAMVSLPPSAVVTKAVYGKLATSNNQTVDLTRKLSLSVADGEMNVPINNALAGGDPAPNTPKELRVDYMLDGVVKHISVAENDTLSLPEGSQTLGHAPGYELDSSETGGMVVRSFEPGSFEFKTSAGKEATAAVGPLPAPISLDDNWQLSFPPNWGAPESIVLDKLISWTDHTDSGVKYFSGTAVYQKDIEIPGEDFDSGREIWLDLGSVKNFAEVSLNGTPFGVLWKPPFRVNVTGAGHPGKNSLQIKVTNLWPNRLIGDEQLPDDRSWKGKQLADWPQWVLEGKPSPTGRLTFTTWHHWTKDDKLLESGLIGPVTIKVADTKLIESR
jgi:hypothetical protein